MSVDVPTRMLRDSFRASLERLDLAEVTKAFCETQVADSRVVVLAVGKAAPTMFAGLRRSLCTRIVDALVVTTDGTDCSAVMTSARVVQASHPVPDQRSVFAATEAVNLVQRHRDLPLLALISGGSSALLCLPPSGLALDIKVRVNDELLKSGADIKSINTVRRHFSRIKGGRLALATRAPVLSVVASDVVGGALHDIGSGPTCPDPTSLNEARALSARFLSRRLARQVDAHFTESLKPSEVEAKRCVASIVQAPESLADAMAKELRGRGMTCSATALTGLDTHGLVAVLIKAAHSLSPGSASVFSCEPTVVLCANPGRGGRAGWVALRALHDLPDDTSLLCAASDGVDGSSEAGGACVHHDHGHDVGLHEAQHALGTFNDAVVHEHLGTHLPGKPTGLNLTDVYVVARGSS